MRTKALTVAVVCLPLFGVVLGMTPASADTPGCVTRAEYRAVHQGMTKARVHGIFDTTGRRLFLNHGQVSNEGREYRVCGHPRSGGSYVQVQYNNYAAGGGPLLVGRKQIHISG